MKKLYVYVDETGQDTEGTFFIVSVLIVEDSQEIIDEMLEMIEQETAKKSLKWIQTSDVVKNKYIRKIFTYTEFKNHLWYRIAVDTTDYVEVTIETIAAAIKSYTKDEEYKATIFIDGLPKSQYKNIGSALRKLEIRTRKVRGMTDENSPSIRLVDAVCGFVRSCHEGDEGMSHFFEKVEKEKWLNQV